MKRLGYTSYVAQGGDWGSVVVDYMGVQAPKGLLAIHTNMHGVVPPAIDAAASAGAPAAAGPPGHCPPPPPPCPVPFRLRSMLRLSRARRCRPDSPRMKSMPTSSW